MTSLLCVTLVQTVLLAAGTEAKTVSIETYAEAHRTTTETGKPMVVMVGTDWCPPCQTMKKSVLPRVREHGMLKKVAFAVVNPDRDKNLAQELTGGGPIPQLVMFRRSGNGGWLRTKLVGGQSVEAVEEFIEDGLADDKAEKKSGAKAREVKAPPAAERTASRRDEAA